MSTVEWYDRGPALELVVVGDLGESSVSNLQASACTQCTDEYELLLIRPEMPFLDSDGLEVLTSYCGEIGRRGVLVVVVTARPALMRVFEAHGFDQQAQLIKTFDESRLEVRKPHRCHHDPPGQN